MKNKTIYIYIPFFIILFILTYYDIFLWMYGRYVSPDSYYSHGFLVPFVSAYFIWQKKDVLKNIPLESSWVGFAIVLLSILLHFAGTILYVFSLSGFSIFLFIFGSCLYLFGKAFTKEILFSILFLLFMFPLPMAFISVISFPLKMIVAKIGVKIISFLGIPILREGFNITIPAGNLVVGNPCSGLRSLISFMALGAVLGKILDISIIKRLLLFLLTIPVAVCANMVRVPILILVSHYYGLKAAAPDTLVHTGSGLLVFLIGFFALFLIGRSLEWRN